MNRSPFDQVYFQKQFDEVLTPAVSQGFPFAKSAMITATLDLMGQITGLPLHRFFGGKLRDKVELTYALSIDKPDVMAAAAKSYPFVNCFKLKVAGDEKLDNQRVRAVIEARPDVDIWLDANQSYRPIHMETFLKSIAGLPRCVSRAACQEHGLVRIKTRSGAERIAYRARRGLLQLLRCGAPGAHGSWRSGGPESRESGRSVGLPTERHRRRSKWPGTAGQRPDRCRGEPRCGHPSVFHLDLILPPELNGPEFLTDLMVDGLKIEGCTVTVPDGPGLGVRVNEAKIRANQIAVNL